MSQSTKGRLCYRHNSTYPHGYPRHHRPSLGALNKGNNAPCPDHRWPQLSDAPRRGLSNALLHGHGGRLGPENGAAQGAVSKPVVGRAHLTAHPAFTSEAHYTSVEPATRALVGRTKHWNRPRGEKVAARLSFWVRIRLRTGFEQPSTAAAWLTTTRPPMCLPSMQPTN